MGRVVAVHASFGAGGLDWRDCVRARAGAVRLGDRHHDQGRLERTHLPTTAIVETGPYRFTRNPIYLGMFLGLVGLAIAFDSLWLLVMLVPFTLAIRYGVVAREEAYLERKFGDAYRQYRARVRRWV